MNRLRQTRAPEPSRSVADPRAHLLAATSKPVPKDADVLVTINRTIELAPLAQLARRLKGQAQAINLGADIFLAEALLSTLAKAV